MIWHAHVLQQELQRCLVLDPYGVLPNCNILLPVVRGIGPSFIHR